VSRTSASSPPIDSHSSSSPTPHLRRHEAAAFLGISPKTLSNWASAGAGPPFHRLGGVVVYSRSSLDAFLSASLVQTTGAAA